MNDLWESLRTMEFVDDGNWDYGSFPWNKGWAGTYTVGPHSEERKEKISMALKGNIPWNKGKKGVQIPSDETKEKMSESHKGQTPWNKGQSKYTTEEEKLEAKREARRKHEAANRDEINRRKREKYAANKEEERRKQRERYAAECNYPSKTYQ